MPSEHDTVHRSIQGGAVSPPRPVERCGRGIGDEVRVFDEPKGLASWRGELVDLAALFDVTRRTIERDLAALRFAGVPVDGDVGRTGGYSLARAKGSVVFSLSPEEVVALLLAGRAASAVPFTMAGTWSDCVAFDPPDGLFGSTASTERSSLQRLPGSNLDEVLGWVPNQTDSP